MARVLAGVLQAPPEHGLVFQVSWKSYDFAVHPKMTNFAMLRYLKITCSGKCHKFTIAGAFARRPAHTSGYNTLQMSLQQVRLHL